MPTKRSRAVALVGAEHARADHEIRLVREDRAHQIFDLRRQVLSVRVHRHDDLRTAGQRDVEAEAQRRAAAASHRRAHDQRAGVACRVAGRVLAAVVDDEALHGARPPTSLGIARTTSPTFSASS